MFYSITGKLIHKENCFAAVETGGVAFGVHTSANSLKDLELNEEITLFTKMIVREDAIELCGFSTLQELNVFKMLLTVSGIGVKAAVSILSAMTAEDFALNVASGETQMLTSVKGIGAKTASRIVLELKDKVTKDFKPSKTTYSGAVAGGAGGGVSNITNALAALTVLGYSQNEVAPIIAKLDRSLSTSDIIKEVLKFLGKKK